MPKFKKYDWPTLFSEFEECGLSQVEFCAKHDINPKYFSVQRSKRLRAKAGNFVQLQQSDSKGAGFEGVTLQVGACKVLCPESMPIPSLASLVRALA